MRLTRNEIIACYLLDRADQYQTDSGSWIPLADAAEAVMHNEHVTAYVHGEFDPELVARVRSIGKRGRK